MNGKIKKMGNAEDGYIYPITVSEAVYVNSTTKLSDYLSEINNIGQHSHSNLNTLNKISDIDGSFAYNGVLVGGSGASNSFPSNTYVIELTRWGITTGIPMKPWVDAHYIMADANIQGINNAIQWAADNGYNYIVVPKNSYAFCYPNTIVIDRSYLTLDLNGSTFKALYNSDVKSPLDTINTSEFWRLQGQCFVFSNAHHSKIINGKIFGERLDRSFLNSAEKQVEWTSGVLYRLGSSNCTVSDCEIAFFMADSVAFSSTALAEYAEFNLTLTVNDLDKTTGQPITATGNTLISQMLTIPSSGAEPAFNAFGIVGQGSTRQTWLTAKEIGVYYYKSDNSFIAYLPNQNIYAPMTIPAGATKYRFVFYNETNTTKTSSTQFAIHLKFGLSPHHNYVLRNEIYGNHRGGIQPGGNECEIAYNTIHDIGLGIQPGGVDIYGKAIFNDPTRYAINQEDFYGNAVHIHNNLIYGCYAGILCGCLTALIESNRVYNCGTYGINIYTTLMTTIKDNYLYKCGNGGIGLMDSHFSMGHVEICGNTITGMTGSWGGNQYHVNIHDNFMIDAVTASMIQNDTHSFKNNHFKWNSYYTPPTDMSYPTITIDKIDGCSFEFMSASSKLVIAINSYNVENCSFSNLDISFAGRFQTTKRENVRMTNCRLNNSVVGADTNFSTLMKKQVTIILMHSTLTDTIIRASNSNALGEHSNIKVKESDLIIKNLTYFMEPIANKPSAYSIIQMEDCNIELNNTTGFLYLIKNSYTTSPKTSEASFKRCVFNYTGGSALNLAYYSHLNSMRSFISADNTYININLPAEDVIFIGYDPSNQSKNADPTFGYFKVGKTISNINAASGGFLGRVCTVEGYASNTTWSASKVTDYGDQMYVGSRIYESTTFEGKTVKTQPTPFPTTLGGTITESGVTPWTSKSHALGDIVAPITPNGLFYECVQAGISSATEPTWNINPYSTFLDGTVRWQGFRLITWKDMGLKAVFNPYGLIQ